MIDPLYLFVFAGLFTPGPNVIMLTASGARFGLKPTLPHILGVAAGVGITSALTALGIGAPSARRPGAQTHATGPRRRLDPPHGVATAPRRRRHGGHQGPPLHLRRSRPFPMGEPEDLDRRLAAATGYASDLPAPLEALRIGSAFSGINLVVCLFWTFAGTLLAYLLTTPKAWRIFTAAMALALAASGVMVFFA